MRNNEIKLSFKEMLFKGAFVHNPVLTQIIGICPIVACCKKVSDALCISVMLTVVLAFNEVLTSLLLKKVQRWIRVAVYTVFSSVIIAVLSPVLLKLTDDGGAGVGIYLYILCTNALVVIRCEKFSCKVGVSSCIKDALSFGIGYGAVALLVAAVREYLLFQNTVAANSSFVALIILGFLAAVHKKAVKSFFPGEITDTFSLSKVNDKPVLKDPGLFKAKKNETAQFRSRHENIYEDDRED